MYLLRIFCHILNLSKNIFTHLQYVSYKANVLIHCYEAGVMNEVLLKGFNQASMEAYQIV